MIHATKINLHSTFFLFFILLFCINSNSQQKEVSLTKPGSFVLGCNYWASHAGTNMWKDWRADVVEEDFKQMSEAGIEVIRVFPVWPDFQPIHQFYSGKGSLKEIRFKDRPLPVDGPGKNGVSIEALQLFKELADIAQRHNIKLIVALVTGWMSGQLFVPPALEGRKTLNDPVSIMWQTKMVTTMVATFKNHPSIIAWDLGNECNEMDMVENNGAAYLWTAAIANAIKAQDNIRPVVSGMHSLSSDRNAKWKIQDQAELTDVLTTHPYPFWTPHTNQDPANTIRTIMHSAAETRYYGDIGNKPCLVEETGIMGPMEANEVTKTGFLRSILYNNWVHDGHGVMWWCAYDQNHLNFTPYEWYAVERDLGLFRTDRTAKPIVSELKDFRSFLNKLPFSNLPQRKTEAVCILTDGQDQWGVAYSSFILSKQAGFDLQFRHAGQALPEAPLYILPSVKGLTLINRTDWLALLEKVKSGATLFVSFDLGFLSHFNEAAGFEVVSSQNRNAPAEFISVNKDILPFTISAERRLNIKPTTGKVLANEKDGNPVFIVNNFGKGKIYFLPLPLETNLTTKPGVFQDKSNESWKVYAEVAKESILQNRVVAKQSPFIGITEHQLSDNEILVVLINYTPNDIKTGVSIKGGWEITDIYAGNKVIDKSIIVAGNNVSVLKLTNRSIK